MSIDLNNEDVIKIEEFIATDPIAKPNPPQRYDAFTWELRGKPLREFYNEIKSVKYLCDNFFLIDFDLLHYNFQNRRIRIYLQEWESQKRQSPQNFKSPVV